MADYSLVAAIASAVAAAGSVLVAWFSFRQQRAAARASDIDKNIDRLIALSAKANSLFSTPGGQQRSFYQVAEVTNILNSALVRIIKLKTDKNLSDEEVDRVSSEFISHLSFEILQALKSHSLPRGSNQDRYFNNGLGDINVSWLRLHKIFHEKEKIE